jgi:hypothetical protein
MHTKETGAFAPLAENNRELRDNNSESEFMEMWHLFATGDFEIFSRNFLALPGKGVDMQPLFYGKQINKSSQSQANEHGAVSAASQTE